MDPWYDEPAHPYRDPLGWSEPAPELDRLTHLVLVDGRLVAAWSEPVRGTRWQHVADRFDAERRPPLPPPPPAPPAHEQALGWLDEACGGRAAVQALTSDPLSAEGLELPHVADPDHRVLLEETAALLDAVAERWWDDETALALRGALLTLWREEPEVVVSWRSPAQLAGGICWVVGKSNGLLGAQATSMRAVQGTLGLSGQLSGPGRRVRSALRGFREWSPEGRWGSRPVGVPDYEPLGHPELLVSTVRARLVRLRDQALAAAA